MIQKIAFIGVTGNLAPFAYKELIKKGIHIKALVRDVSKIDRIADFPTEIEIHVGDLANMNSLREVLKDVDAIYLNLSTIDPKAAFQPEIDGVKNVIKLLRR
ncbi:MAG: SDR family oxidoreductase [Bacteroidales bacterium]|nr:SDR family oxidoreductase [Bacteroidales bacterium]